MFWIKETIAAFLARKGLQNSIWHEALEFPAKEQGIRKDTCIQQKATWHRCTKYLGFTLITTNTNSWIKHTEKM